MRRLAGWGLRLLLVALGVWLGYEALIFPRIAPLASEAPARTSFMRHREAEAKAAGKPYRIDQRWVDARAISPRLGRAVLAAEDNRFYEHEGFDTEEIKDAIEDHLKEGKKLRGASTISQQLAKNLWLGPQRSWLRKLREAVYTWALERRIEKDRILELYLNLVEWGPGVFGAEAAARRYFGVPAAALDAHQAALLAAALPAPLKRDPGRPGPGLLRRARLIERRMRALGPPPAATPADPPGAAAPSRPVDLLSPPPSPQASP